MTDAELKALAEKANAAVRGAPIFQWVGRGDCARSGYLTSPHDDSALHSSYWLLISDTGSGSDLTNAEAAALREHIAACSPDRILALLSRLSRAEEGQASEPWVPAMTDEDFMEAGTILSLNSSVLRVALTSDAANDLARQIAQHLATARYKGLSRAEARVQRLEEALAEFGKHHMPCQVNLGDPRCDCGLDTALAEKEGE